MGSKKGEESPFAFMQEPETPDSKLLRKSQEAPLFPIGIAGLTAVVGYGIYKYRYRGEMSTSIYLMQMRVMAQSAVVLCLTAGVTYKMVNDFLRKREQ